MLLKIASVFCLVPVLRSGAGPGLLVTIDMIVAHLGTNSCVGGDDGLTNTSVLVQYRTTENSRNGWGFLAEIRADMTFDGSMNLALDNSVESFQMRLLQLEHGGWSCNCWSVEKLYIRAGNICNTTNLQLDDSTLCLRRSLQVTSHLFCREDMNLSASRARGALLKPLNLQICSFVDKCRGTLVTDSTRILECVWHFFFRESRLGYSSSMCALDRYLVKISKEKNG